MDFANLVCVQVDDGPDVRVEQGLRIHHLHHQGGGVRGCQTGWPFSPVLIHTSTATIMKDFDPNYIPYD